MKTDFLVNAPLKEVLFEMHWDLELDPEDILYDPGFESAIEKFIKSCQQDFKEVTILKPDSIPSKAYINRVTHRFFKIKGQHPLYQAGPGVFTVNDNNKNYIWKDFFHMVKDGIKCLQASYERELTLSKVQLRYIDSVSPYILGDEDKFEFLKKHMNINVESYPFVDGELKNIHFAKSFNIDESKNLNLTISTGVNKDTTEDVIEWHTYIENIKRITWSGLNKWLEDSHSISSSVFKNMVSDELYQQFSK